MDVLLSSHFFPNTLEPSYSFFKPFLVNLPFFQFSFDNAAILLMAFYQSAFFRKPYCQSAFYQTPFVNLLFFQFVFCEATIFANIVACLVAYFAKAAIFFIFVNLSFIRNTHQPFSQTTNCQVILENIFCQHPLSNCLFPNLK